MIAEVSLATLADGREVVVKRCPYPPEIEAEGLAALVAAGGPVPGVLAVSDELLVLEHVTGPPDWEGLGRALAALHGEGGASFGWHRDNLIGTLPQENAATGDWPSFWAERRVLVHCDDPAVPRDLAHRLRAACEGLLQDLLATSGAEPSLVHGDLWSGNVVAGRWLIDPAAHRADREVDLAFADMFGGFPDAFWRAYEEAWPLREGWRERRPALQLHHALVHVRMFGAGYVPAVTSRLDRLGW